MLFRPTGIVLCLFFFPAWQAGCSETRNNTVTFVIPVGFRGGVRIEALRKPGSRRVEHLRFNVPTDGIVRLEGEDPFEQWAETIAKFSDDSLLPIARQEAPGTPPLPTSTIKLWNEVSGWVFVGDDSAFRKWAQRPSVGRVVER